MKDRIDRLRRSVALGWAAFRRRTEVVTATAWLVAGLSIAGWFVGWRLGWLEGMWIAATGAVVLVVALLFMWGRSEIAIDLLVDPQRVTVGEPSGGVLVVTNAGGGRLLALRVELPVGRNQAIFDVPGLAGNASHSEEFVLPTSRRQVIAVGPATSVRGDPLGLFRRAVSLTDAIRLYVHPKIARLDNLGSGFLRDLEGQPTADLSNSDVAFHTLREYQPGDDRRFVHWKTTARIGTLMIRQFVDTRRSHLAVLLDTQPRSYRDADEFELAVSIAGSLGARALRDEQDVTITSGAGPLGSLDGRHLLDSLAGVDLDSRGRDLVAQAALLNRTAAAVSIVALVCGSDVSLADCRAAANRFGPSTRIFVIRADLAGTTSIRPLGLATILDVATLDEFPHLMWKVSQS